MPPAGDTLEMRPPAADLASYLFAFVYRRETDVGGVVRILPELRASIQIQTADPYWLREREPSAKWEQTPRIALWGPRFDWGYGFAASRIKAYAVGLTAKGLRTITGMKTALLLNKVCGLEAFNAALAARLDPFPDEPFGAWSARAAEVLRAFFASAPAQAVDFNSALRILATSEGGAVARAARESGLSERQFRRVFEDIHGAAPKRYQRALRVDRMIRQLHPAPWEKDAYEGEPLPFADQPHAIREFREMTSMTPANYVAAKRNSDRALRSIAVEGVAPPNSELDAVSDDDHAAARR